MAAGTEFTRRAFVQTLGSLTALGGFASIAPWRSAAAFRSTQLLSSTRFAFVSSAADAIQVFAIDANGTWRQTQTVSSAAPVSLTLSPDQRFLYVANAITSFRHLPTGSVEAYAVDPDRGSLTRLNRRALALSAVVPKHLAISPDGRQLAVAVEGGIAYNLLPLDRDGSIGRVTASIKHLGAGADPSGQSRPQASPLPQSVLFHPDGTLFAADLGSNRLSSFSVTRDGALSLREHHNCAPCSGPAHMVAHPSGDVLFIAGSLSPILSSIRCKFGSEQRLQSLQQVRCSEAGGGITALSMHPSGSLLFAADATGISVALTDPAGAIQLASRHTEGLDVPVALAVSQDGEHLVALNRGDNSLTRFDSDLKRARLSNPVRLATAFRPVAIVLRHL
jgi:6-phosphogluconolactonase